MPEYVSSACTVCNGTGLVLNELCLNCMGDGTVPIRGMKQYLKQVNIDNVEKLQELKIKINKMQADINYIRAKVG